MPVKPALIVIDMQNGFIRPESPCYIAGAEASIPACAAAAAYCREKGYPVFFVTRRYRADGSDVEHTRYKAWAGGGKPLSPGCADEISAQAPEALTPQAGDYAITKPRFSAFFHTELDLMLRRLGVDTVILAGTTTPNCIRTSCYDAMSLEYNVVVLSDATSSTKEEIQQANLLDMANVGAQVLSTEELIAGAGIIESVGWVHSQVCGEE